MSKRVRLEVDGRGVAGLTLTRAEKHNAMDREMIDALAAAAAEIGAHGDIRAVVLAAEGRSFCAGGDLGWMRDQMAADRKTRIAEARRLAGMLAALDGLDVPLFAAVQGQAFGGGLGLIAVADIAIGVEGAKFGLTEARLGLVPATISPYVVARMGPARSREVFVSARIFDAAEAMRLGLLAQVVPEQDLAATVESHLLPVLASAPGAVAGSKRLWRRLAGTATAAQVDMSIETLADRWETAEAAAGIAAFFEKRPAPWA